MKKKLIIAIAIFTAIGVGIFYFLTTGNIGAKYNTAEVKKGEVGKYVEEAGRVSSRTIRRYYGNSISKVKAINVSMGDYIEEGQVLIEFEDNLDLDILKVKKQIEALEATYHDATSGADIESINSAKIEIARITSNLELATKNMDRIEELYKNGAIAQVELEQATNSVQQLKSSLAVAQNNYNQLIKGVSGNTRKRYEAEIDVLLLTLESLERSRDNSTIVADFHGVVTEVNTFQGDIPHAGLLILEIHDPREKILSVDFMVEDALNIKTGMRAEVVDWNLGIEIRDLKVHKVHPKAFITISQLGVEENRQTVEIGLQDESEGLPYGLEVKTRVVIDESREVLLIPEEAVYLKAAGEYVEVLENGEPLEREIVTGTRDGNNIEVIEGLELGEKVVLKYREN